MRDRLFIVVLVVALVLLPAACQKKEQPADTQTTGNATDRSPVTGTSGTGEPRSVATESAASATQLTTAPTGTVVSSTEVVHATTTGGKAEKKKKH